jgi:2-phosphosulfolactate phosphatase
VTPESVLNVVFLPSTVSPESLTEDTVIVVDVLRATTTIISALANGASKVLPQPSIEAAREVYADMNGDALLGGERQGQIVDGFTNGNSPVEYTSDVVADKTVILATTNGTVAMEHCRQAKQILIGAMVNIQAVAEDVLHEPKVTVMCSGTDRIVTSEDILFAGAMIDRICSLRKSAGIDPGKVTDTAMIAVNHWKQTKAEVENGKPLADFFRTARGGINLVRIGLDHDIVFACQIDSLPHVPKLCQDSWSIKL